MSLSIFAIVPKMATIIGIHFGYTTKGQLKGLIIRPVSTLFQMLVR